MRVIEEKSQIFKGLLERTECNPDYNRYLSTSSMATAPQKAPRSASPLGTYPELCQIELRGIIAQDRHQRRRPWLGEQTTAEGSSWGVHSLAVPGNVAGSQVDQYIIYVEGWPEYCLRKPLSYPSMYSFPHIQTSIVGYMPHEHKNSKPQRENSQGQRESGRTPRIPTRLPYCQAP